MGIERVMPHASVSRIFVQKRATGRGYVSDLLGFLRFLEILVDFNTPRSKSFFKLGSSVLKGSHLVNLHIS